MPRPISAAEAATAAQAVPIRLTIVTMDTHLASATERVRPVLAREFPGLSLHLHAASEFSGNERLTAQVRQDIAQSDIIVAGMLFLEDHFMPLSLIHI